MHELVEPMTIKMPTISSKVIQNAIYDWALVNGFNAPYGVRDLWVMHRAVYQLLREADREWVNCRRRGVGSPRFDQLLTEAEEQLRNFEGHLLLAKLMHRTVDE